MTAPIDKTVVQQLPELVDWFIQDRDISLEFSYNERHAGKLIPEYDLMYFLKGRQITERGIAMMLMTEMLSRNYRFSLAQILSALTSRAWDHYVNSFVPPEWIAEVSRPIPEKRPVGRPRKAVRASFRVVGATDA